MVAMTTISGEILSPSGRRARAGATPPGWSARTVAHQLLARGCLHYEQAKWRSAEQAARRDAEGLSQLLHYCDCGIAPPPLDVADVGAVDAGAVGVVFLAPTLGFTQSAHILAKAFADVHGRLKTAMSLIDLQTISHIRLDLPFSASITCHSSSIRKLATCMVFWFNQLLEHVGVRPSDTRLLRHQTRLLGGRTPLSLWHEDRPAFEHYQAHQLHAQRPWFEAGYWASFAGEPGGRTMFLGLYRLASPVPVEVPFTYEVAGTHYGAGEIDFYSPQRVAEAEEFAGRVYVEWGGGASGKRAWRQKADIQNKRITELLRDAAAAPFPGLMQLSAPVSFIAGAPAAWQEHLTLARGVYLLRCPRTGEHYVGSASGSGGFWGRWMAYEADGHGGNVALRLRENGDWIVSVLEVAGSTASHEDILAAEGLWKRKLGSRDLGLNRN